MTLRQLGMDHTHYPYLPTPLRAQVSWPGGAALAAGLVLYMEEWELDPPADAHRDPRFNDPAGYFAPDYRTYSFREYGNRVGIFRILGLLDQLGIPFTTAISAVSSTRMPALVDALIARRTEFAGHGLYATRMLTSALSAEQERAAITSSLDTITAATGTRPVGWIGQDYGESIRTPDLLVEARLSYVADWPNDDQPYLLRNGLVSLPNQAEWDDVQLLWHRRLPLNHYAELVQDAFDVLLREGSLSGRFFGLHVHPWVLGAPHRFQHLVSLLTRLRERSGVWWATHADIARHVARQPGEFGTAA